MHKAAAFMQEDWGHQYDQQRQSVAKAVALHQGWLSLYSFGFVGNHELQCACTTYRTLQAKLKVSQ